MANGAIPPLQTVTSIESIVKTWPWASVKVAREMVKKYGLSHEASEGSLIWHYNDPWNETVVRRDGVYHSFPRPHLDVVEQTVSYLVPAEMIEKIAAYNGSIMVNRPKGEIICCCANEAMNFLMINLVHEIVLGHISPQQARERHREIIQGLRLNWPEPFTLGLEFTVVPTSYGADESGESKIAFTGPFSHHRR